MSYLNTRECGRNRILRGRNRDRGQIVHNILAGDTISGGPIISGLASEVGFGEVGVAYIYIYTHERSIPQYSMSV